MCPVTWGAGQGEAPAAAWTHVTGFSKCVVQAPTVTSVCDGLSLPLVLGRLTVGSARWGSGESPSDTSPWLSHTSLGRQQNDTVLPGALPRGDVVPVVPHGHPWRSPWLLVRGCLPVLGVRPLQTLLIFCFCSELCPPIFASVGGSCQTALLALCPAGVLIPASLPH